MVVAFGAQGLQVVWVVGAAFGCWADVVDVRAWFAALVAGVVVAVEDRFPQTRPAWWERCDAAFSHGASVLGGYADVHSSQCCWLHDQQRRERWAKGWQKVGNRVAKGRQKSGKGR